MKKSAGKAFLISCLLWATPGLVSGSILAAYASAGEYQSTAVLSESILRGESLPSALKHRFETDDRNKEGSLYLERYGHSKFGNWDTYLPGTMGICLLLFETAGAVVFFLLRREEKKRTQRILELTTYLKTAETGDAAALTRKEDTFSHLEDEIYKTVVLLAGTKEEAVKDHEVLAARIADIAHQLKTPLTSMSLMTELLEPCCQAEKQEYLDRLRKQVERLQRLVDSLLTLAKLDSHTLELKQESLEIEELIHEAVSPLRDMLRQKPVNLHICNGSTETQDIFINADSQWMTEALSNIIKNCMEHTPQHGDIFLKIEKNPLYTELLITDSGKGISKKDLPHIFERFYRGEHAAKDSAGIGLALAKAIIEKQNGQIQAQNTEDGHACFRIRFYP